MVFNRRRVPALLLAGLLGLSGVAQAQTTVQSQRLTEAPADVGDAFGRRVALSGSTLIVGMNGDDDEGGDAGAAVVFVKEDGQWVRRQKLVVSALETGDFFGWSVAIDGDVAVVGAPGDDRRMPTGVVLESVPNRGAAYVFRRNTAGDWELETRLEGEGAETLDEFGGRVAVSGDTILVSAYHDDHPVGSTATGGAADLGSVWVFVRSNGSWQQQARLVAPHQGQWFGFALAIEGDRAVIGDPGSGQGYVATRTGTSWALVSLEPSFGQFQQGHGPSARFGLQTGLTRLANGTFIGTANPQPFNPFFYTYLASVTSDGDVGLYAQILAPGHLPGRLATDASGNVFIGIKTYIAKRAVDGTLTVFAGTDQPGLADGQGGTERFTDIRDLTFDNNGDLVVVDSTAIRRVSPTAVVSTIAGSASAGYVNDTGTAARFQNPLAIAVGLDNTLYVSDHSTVRAISSGGVVTTLAGVAGSPGTSDGTGGGAQLLGPLAMGRAPTGEIVLAETDRFRTLTAGGVVNTFAISAAGAKSIDGPVGSAVFAPRHLVVVSASEMYFSTGTELRHLASGVVTTLAGIPTESNSDLESAEVGYSVALSGTRIVLGAPRATPPLHATTKAGTAWVFDYDGTSWSAGTPLLGSAAAATERLGESVAIVSTTDVALAGANGCTWTVGADCTDDSLGTVIENTTTPVRLFRHAGGAWSEIAQLKRNDTAARRGFGATLATNGSALAAGAPGPDLFPSTTAGEAIVFDLATVDRDNDGLPDQWETQFHLDPLDSTGVNGGSGDADGDGQTNAQEYAAQSHPDNLSSATRYLAEGATGFFETRISVANPGNADAAVLLRFLRGDSTVRSYTLTVPAMESRKVAISTLPDMSNAAFSTVVESDQLVVVDRQMWWDSSAYGTHAEAAVSAPALTWYFAEGATHSGFDLFYLLQNANDTDAQVRVRYLRPSGAPLEKTYVVPANTRFNIWVDLEQFPAGSGNQALASSDVSAVIEVLNSVPIIAERAMYLTGSGALFEAGHESAGVTAPALNWFLAEGATGTFFDEFILLANPSSTDDAQVRATYLLPDGSTLTKLYTVPANARTNIWVDAESFPDGNGGQVLALADAAVSTTLEVLNNVPIIVERAMWWPGPTAATWAEAHNAFGSTATAERWGFAEGVVLGPPTNTDTYFLVANTGSAAGRVRVTLLFDDGTAPASREYDVLAKSRLNVPVRVDFPSAIGKGFGALIESIGASPVPIVVERAMYNDAGGQFWRAGNDALGTPLP
ncbi:MAG: hypothetical protein AB7I50_07615 [Vicinamibacterales bacterium]